MFVKIIALIIILSWMAVNYMVAKNYSEVQMRKTLIKGSTGVNRVFANVFFSFAWLLKFAKRAVTAMIA